MKKLLLAAGIASSLLYVATDALAAMQWDAYSYTGQMVSELMAIGAPTRPLLVTLFTVYDALVIAFGLGVYEAAAGKRSLRVTGILLVAYAVIGQFGLMLFPMHARGAQGTMTDVMHATTTAVIVALFVAILTAGAIAGGRAFRIYSIATIVVLILFGSIAGLSGARMAAGVPTPWMGVTERINIFSTLLWFAVFAVMLLRTENRASAGPKRRPRYVFPLPV